MKKIAFVALIICIIVFNRAFALDWKMLHERADSKNIDSALADIKANPKSTDVFYVLGLVYLNLHQDSKAEEAFSEVLKRDPKSIEAQWGVAEVLRRQHKLDKAEVVLPGIIKNNPKFAPAYITLAYIRYMRMDFKESARLALMVIQQGRENVDLSNYTRAYAMYAGAKGMTAHYGGLILKAIDGLAVKPNLDKAEKLQPDSAGVLFGLGSYYFLAPRIAGGDKAKAEIYLNKAIQSDPLFPDAYVRLAQLYKIRGNNSRYDFYMDKALKLDPENELALDHLSGRCKFICVGGEEKPKQ